MNTNAPHIQLAVIGNTYGYIHPSLLPMLESVHAVLHVGDIGDGSVLRDLAKATQVFAVRGDADASLPDLPDHRVVEFPFGNVGMTHGHLYPSVLRQRISSIMNSFRDSHPRLVVKGHSRKFLAAVHEGTLLINPGAACPPIDGSPSSLAMVAWDPELDIIACRPVFLDWPTELRMRESTGGTKYHFVRQALGEAMDAALDERDPAETLLDTTPPRR